jgi:hypothetical protein
MSAQIIAIGGGGFSTESEPRIDEYVLAQAVARKPKTTAPGIMRHSWLIWTGIA